MWWWSGRERIRKEDREEDREKRTSIEAQRLRKGGVMWRGEKTVSERMKIKFRLHRREHCLRANKKKRMKRWPAAVLWLAVGQSPIFLMGGAPFQSLSCFKPCTAGVQYQLLKQLLDCWRVDMARSQQTNVEELPVTECGDSWGQGYRKRRKKGRGVERMGESF